MFGKQEPPKKKKKKKKRKIKMALNVKTLFLSECVLANQLVMSTTTLIIFISSQWSDCTRTDVSQMSKNEQEKTILGSTPVR